ncbi:MAG: UDP-2,4-diacetamido-2,4,6-trideoxy-beta-L-altropyranose hydrolase [Pseudomonadota bacterium]|nr:UDP-2,4-diacetamido-2,4,6-trideoxy-beta-L-altropyranose hydrolase [Pseudomonadota bacterium]
MRCLALASALARRGARVSFVCGSLPPELAERIEAAGHGLFRIDALSDAPSDAGGWEAALVAHDEQQRDARSTLRHIGAADWIVVDHYRLDRHWQSSARSGAARIMVIDDLANRDHDCDLLVDQTFGRDAADYHARLSPNAHVAAGSAYALLSDEFAVQRVVSLARRRASASVRSVLISLGSTDIGGISARALQATLDADVGARVMVVLGKNAPSMARVAELARTHAAIEIIHDSREMARLMVEADLAVGAGGVSAWERCCLGLPTVMIALAENQKLVLANLGLIGAAAIVDDPAQLTATIRGLASDQQMRFSMVAAAAAIVDGCGANRVADLLLDCSASRAALVFRKAETDDSEMVWLWRNDPEARAASQTQLPVPWPAHQAWYDRALVSPDRLLLVAEAEGKPVGVVRFDKQPDDAFEISINVRPDARGRGAGTAILAGACRAFLESVGPARLDATIHENNPGSQRIFRGLGFKPDEELGESGFRRYVRAKGAL